MNKTWFGVVGAVVVVAVLVWLIAGDSINCHKSFWDKDKQVIEINR